jgi:hypothetical protein
VEYTNPQLTVEEIQGIIGARLLGVAGNYFLEKGLHEPDEADVSAICSLLPSPPEGKIVSFLLNTDDVEPDRYSMNPLRSSIVESGQSAFPAASVQTNGLHIDEKYAEKYQSTLICKGETDLVADILGRTKVRIWILMTPLNMPSLRITRKFLGWICFCLR